MDRIKEDTDLLKRHHRIAEAARFAIKSFGLSLYAESGYSDTVTVFKVPVGMNANEILSRMREVHQLMLAGSFGSLEGKVLRIGHMGANANFGDMLEVMAALEETLRYFGWNAQNGLAERFQFKYNQMV